MNDRFITITVSDLINIISLVQKVGHRRNYVTRLLVVKPRTTAEGMNSQIAIEESSLVSAGDDEPTPVIQVLY